MQLIVMIHAAGVQLAPSHMKRDYNKWADELTHPDFTGFRPDRQLPVREAFSHFRFLWALLDDQMNAPTLSGNNSKRRKTDYQCHLRSFRARWLRLTFLCTVVFSHLNNPCYPFSLARA